MKKLSLLVLCALVTVQLAGCTPRSPSRGSDQPVDIASADLSGTGPGSLTKAETMPRLQSSLPLGSTAARVIYRSTSGVDGTQTEVSGAVFVPAGRPPAGGWPVIAFAHGTTGVSNECGPSLSPDLWGSAKLVGNFLRAGLAVAATDYQGLGAPGGHPYLDAKTAGYNVIDSVRALRFVSRDIATTWAAFGGSQGGAATWAANEMASTYATDLNLVGSVSLVPAADMSGYAAKATAGTMSVDQEAAYVGMLIGIERTRPGFPIDDYRRGLAKEKWDVLSACFGAKGEERNKVIEQLTAEDLRPATPEAEQRIYDLLRSMALPQQRAAAPMLIMYGGRDEFIEPDWTKNAIQRACELGDTIDAVFQPDKGHGDIDPGSYLQWLGERFAGQPAPNTCTG